MEKINALIEKLQELKNSGADLSAISYYVQLLQAEIMHARNKQHQQETQAGQSQIAVIMPAQQPVIITMPVTTAAQTTTFTANEPAIVPTTSPELTHTPAAAAPITVTPAPEAENVPAQPEPVPIPAASQSPVTTADDVPAKPEPVVVAQPIPTLAANLPPIITTPAPDDVPAKPEPVVVAQPIPTLAASQPTAVPEPHKPAKAATLFDQIDTAPATNGHSTATNGIRKDLNELVGNKVTSLNDRLRMQQVEVAQKLGDLPVMDLRQGIGINDKYQFIQELFHGDKDLYERSIKTLNECASLQEADYWLQREIKIIQGWEDDHHLVQQFYALLRKRFS
ncbi:hypothetical protein [Chitinophaga nivalis]|uniref:Uncharacterized protein n=1 Tax=Chitinophaga nivalis TaxID=2991709 RepID=A0ABT3IEK0_9BACT|nr:hypothetical protein [Chitinophaga nivalis]MCW3467925.1 hypothetical protein [Chitinophaga nivalis]MCW3482384.1 hypothetical protein [Chitinophaga nivalis]